MRITKKAIADHLGISRTAVSLVLNNAEHCTVSEDTKQRILDAAKALGYRTSSAVSKKICFILYNRQSDDPRYMIDLRVIERICSQKGYKLLFHSIQANNGEVGRLAGYVEAEDVDGIILAGDIDDEIINSMNALAIRYISYGGTDRDDVNVILQDAKKVSYNAVKHLLKLGHKRIALFSGTFNYMVHRMILEGYRKAMKNEKIEFDSTLVQVSSSEDGHELAERMQVFETEYSAVFCANTIIQFGALQWYREKGIAVPEKMSLLGYGNSELAKLSSPKLSAYSFDYEEYARIAVDRLITLISGKDTEAVKKIYTNNVIHLQGGTIGKAIQ